MSDSRRRIEAIDDEIAARAVSGGRAARAKAILDDELVVEAIAAMRQQLLDKFEALARDATPHSAQEYDYVALNLRAIENFESRLRKHMNTGKMDAFTLEQLHKERRTLSDRISGIFKSEAA